MITSHMRKVYQTCPWQAGEETPQGLPRGHSPQPALVPAASRQGRLRPLRAAFLPEADEALRQRAMWRSGRAGEAALGTARFEGSCGGRQPGAGQTARAGTSRSRSLLIPGHGWPQLDPTGLNFHTCQEGAS